MENILQKMVLLANRGIDRNEPDLHCSESAALWRFYQNLLAKFSEGQKKVLTFELGVPGTVPYGISAPGYCITFLTRLDEG